MLLSGDSTLTFKRIDQNGQEVNCSSSPAKDVKFDCSACADKSRKGAVVYQLDNADFLTDPELHGNRGYTRKVEDYFISVVFWTLNDIIDVGRWQLYGVEYSKMVAKTTQPSLRVGWLLF